MKLGKCLTWGQLFLILIGSIQAQSLKELAEERGLKIGAAIKDGNRDNNYNSILTSQFNAAVAENAMKPGALQPSRGNFNFTAAENMVNFVLDNDMVMRGHALVWHQQSGFMESINTSREEMFQIMEEHITTVMNRFKGKIYEWDVVNEAVARDSSGMRPANGENSSNWVRQTDGENNNHDYIDSAFTYARRADSNAFLVYNDYDCEGMGIKSQLVYDLVSRLASQGIIDGVGLQCHFHLPGQGGSNGAWDSTQMATNFKRLADLGLRISITELDIRVPTPASQEDLQRQKQAYETVLRICLENPNCTTFMLWGFTDASSWIPQSFSGFGQALIYDANYQPKPAYDGLVAVLSEEPQVFIRKNGFFSVSKTLDYIDVLGRNRQYQFKSAYKMIPVVGFD